MNKWMACMLITITAALLAGCGNKGGEQATTSGGQSVAVSKASQTDLKITSWGPQNTKAGTAFNVQPDGSASFWVRTDRSLEGSDAVIVFNGVQLRSAISGSLITASVPASLYDKPGKYALHIAMHSEKGLVQSGDVTFAVE